MSAMKVGSVMIDGSSDMLLINRSVGLRTEEGVAKSKEISDDRIT